MLKNVLIFTIAMATVGSAEIIPLDDKFVYTIGLIESGNVDTAIGDGGKSISRYQIQRAAFIDAKQYDKSIKFSYQSLTNQAHARKVMTAYLNRYAKKAIKERDFEALARCWNSGPNWARKKHLTDGYWAKFQKHYRLFARK